MWTHLFGKAPLATRTPTKTTDRLVALECALRITRGTTGEAPNPTSVTTRASEFEDWLKHAGDDEQDAQIRRLVLLMLCDHVPPTARADRLRGLAKELHRFITRR